MSWRATAHVKAISDGPPGRLEVGNASEAVEQAEGLGTSLATAESDRGDAAHSDADPFDAYDAYAPYESVEANEAAEGSVASVRTPTPFFQPPAPAGRTRRGPKTNGAQLAYNLCN